MPEPKLTPGTNICKCAGCGEYFTNPGTFDMHRTGKGQNRRCVDPYDVVDKNGIGRLRKNGRGLWARSKPWKARK